MSPRGRSCPSREDVLRALDTAVEDLASVGGLRSPRGRGDLGGHLILWCYSRVRWSRVLDSGCRGCGVRLVLRCSLIEHLLAGEQSREFGARSNAELDVYVMQVRLDRLGANEQRGTGLLVRRSAADNQCEL